MELTFKALVCYILAHCMACVVGVLSEDNGPYVALNAVENMRKNITQTIQCGIETCNLKYQYCDNKISPSGIYRCSLCAYICGHNARGNSPNEIENCNKKCPVYMENQIEEMLLKKLLKVNVDELVERGMQNLSHNSSAPSNISYNISISFNVVMAIIILIIGVLLINDRRQIKKMNRQKQGKQQVSETSSAASGASTSWSELCCYFPKTSHNDNVPDVAIRMSSIPTDAPSENENLLQQEDRGRDAEPNSGPPVPDGNGSSILPGQGSMHVDQTPAPNAIGHYSHDPSQATCGTNSHQATNNGSSSAPQSSSSSPRQQNHPGWTTNRDSHPRKNIQQNNCNAVRTDVNARRASEDTIPKVHVPVARNDRSHQGRPNGIRNQQPSSRSTQSNISRTGSDPIQIPMNQVMSASASVPTDMSRGARHQSQRPVGTRNSSEEDNLNLISDTDEAESLPAEQVRSHAAELGPQQPASVGTPSVEDARRHPCIPPSRRSPRRSRLQGRFPIQDSQPNSANANSMDEHVV